MPSLRDQLVGAWDLIEYSAHKPSDRSNKIHPMGPNAQGIIMYTPDGYMSAQLQRVKSDPPGGSGQDDYVAYTGRFFLDEQGDDKGPLLVHEMRNSNLSRLHGDRQRRLVEIKDEDDGRYLYLSVSDATKASDGEDRLALVRWKRQALNEETRAP